MKPPALKPHGTIRVVAPSSYPDFPRMRLREGVEYLRKRGFTVQLGPNLRNAVRHRYFSASDEDRARELLDAFRDPAVDAVVCARGGIGALRVLPHLDFDVVRDHPKVFVGYSDITAFQMPFWTRAHLVTFQGPMAAVWPSGDRADSLRVHAYNWDLLLRVVSDGEAVTVENPADAPQPKTLFPGTAEGPLVGGNLTLFHSLQGTPFDPPTDGAVLFLEDTEEHQPWDFEERLGSLLLSGKLRAARGLVFGELLEPKGELEPRPSLEEAIAEAVSTLPHRPPSFLNLATGHGRYTLPLAIGNPVRVNADEGTLTMLEPAVER